MMRFLFILPILFPACCLAQSWEISLDGGVALPVGAFGNSDAKDARVYSDALRPDGTPYISYYSFEENGFASTGWFAGIQAAWQWKPAWKLLIQYRYAAFPVTEKPIGDDFAGYIQRASSYYQTDYQIQHLMSGVGKKFTFSSLALHIQALAGVARSGFPYYRIIDEYEVDYPDGHDYPKRYFGHEGERNADYSVIWGGTFLLSYPFTNSVLLDLEVAYVASGFDYHVDPRWIPGGSGLLEYDDHVTYRALNLGLGITWSF